MSDRRSNWDEQSLMLLDLPGHLLEDLHRGMLPEVGERTPAQAVDLRGELADPESRRRIQRLFAQGGFNIIDWIGLGDIPVEPRSWIDDALDTLAERPHGAGQGTDLVKAFTFRDEISLWWLTKVAQKKRAKTPFSALVMLAHRAAAFWDDRLGGGTSRQTTMPPSVWVVSGDRRRARSLVEVTRASLSECQSSPTIRTLVLSEAGGSDGRSAEDAGRPFSRLFGTFDRLFRLLRSLLRTYIGIFRDHLWLRRLRHGADGAESPSTDVLLLSLDVGDFSLDESGHPQENRYLPALPEQLERAGFDTRWLALDENELMDRSTYWATRSALGNDYALLYPGWRTLGSLLLANLRWLATYPGRFLDGRFDEHWTYRGARLGRLVKADYEELLSGHAARLLYLRSCLAAAFARLQPRAVLYLKAFNSIGRIITSAASKGTLMAGVQHGIVNREQIGYLYRSQEIDARPAFKADHVDYCPAPDVLLAFGQRMVDFMSLAGFPAERIRPIGSLRHDRIVSDYLPEKGTGSGDQTVVRPQRREALDLPPDRPAVLLCLQWAHAAGRWFELLVRARECMPMSPHLACKPHPFQQGSEARIAAAAEAGEVDGFSVLRGQIYPMILASDAMVTHSSTAVLDALLLETPVALIEETGLPNDNALFREGGAVWSAQTAEEMAEALTEIIGGNYDVESWHERRRTFLRYNLHNEDAGAVDRLIELLHDPPFEEI